MLNCVAGVVDLAIMMGKHLDRMDVGVAVHHPPRDRAARIRAFLGRRTGAPDHPAHQRQITRDPEQQRQGQPHVEGHQQNDRAHQRRHKKRPGIQHLKHRLARGGRGLHDPVCDTPRKIVFKPAHGLPQYMSVRPPADQRAKVGHQCVVQQRHIDKGNAGAQHEHPKGDKNELEPVLRNDLFRRALRQQVDDAGHIPDEQDFTERDNGADHEGHGNHRAERLQIGVQKGPQAIGRRVAFGIGRIRIDKRFKELEHGKNL